MPDINQQYNQLLRRQIAAINKKILDLYSEAVNVITFKAAKIQFKGNVFRLSDYPLLNKQVTAIINDLQPKLYAILVNAINAGWDLSNAKTDIIVDKRLSGRNPDPKVSRILYDPNKNALKEFLNRTEQGLSLSDRVWNTAKVFRKELEQSLGIGIASGQSAVTMARDMKQYLVNPDKLFRRVKGEDGLQLSKAAKNFHPGQGVYRSSYQNALRVSASETNMAYRTADHTRWNKLPFVLGIQVQTSQQHPKHDICDELAGKYPVDFLFRGWHPRCLCFATTVMMNDEEYNQFEDKILAGEDIGDTANAITEPHAGFSNFIVNNLETINGWKSKPYFLGDNKQYVRAALQR